MATHSSILAWRTPWTEEPSGLVSMGSHRVLKSESEVTQSCPTLSDPMDCSLPGSSTHGIFQARVLEWAAIAFSASKALLLSRFSPVQLCETP